MEETGQGGQDSEDVINGFSKKRHWASSAVMFVGVG